MNLAQLVKRSYLACDGLLPGGTLTSQWSFEEVIDLLNVAYEEVLRRYRFVRKKWGLRRVSQTDPPFTVNGFDGELYTPATELHLPSTGGLVVAGAIVGNIVKLPSDFGEVVRIFCLNNRTVRFMPAEMESFHWIDNEQGSYDRSGNILLLDQPDGLTFFYDVVELKHLYFTPIVSGTFDLAVDYIALKPPLDFGNEGTVQQVGTALIGDGTVFLQNGVLADESLAGAELVTGFGAGATLKQIIASVSLGAHYPRVSRFTSDTAAVMVAPRTLPPGTPYAVFSVPRLPSDTHRWLSEYAATLMLKKINPELAEKYGADVLRRFDESIRPEASRRQSQQSTVTEDAEEFGVGGVI